MKPVWTSKWLSIAEAPDGELVVLSGDEVLVLAFDSEDRLLLIEEPASAFGDRQLLLPGGALEPDEDLLTTANRELREETGFGARSLVHAGQLRPWSKYLTVTSHLVVATDLYPAPLQGDEAYKIDLKPMPKAAVRQMIGAGELRDARVVAALSLHPWLASGAPSAPLRRKARSR